MPMPREEVLNAFHRQQEQCDCLNQNVDDITVTVRGYDGSYIGCGFDPQAAAPLRRLEPRGEVRQHCSHCAENQRWALRVCLVSLAGCVIMAVLAAWRNQ